MFLRFSELDVGFSNAENYRRRENKQLLTKYFVRDQYLDKLLTSSVYFLVGEKGTGKTAYATFLTTNRIKNTDSFSFDVRQTEYQKFLEMKVQGHLPLSQYSEVWRALLLMTAAQCVLEKSGTPEFLKRFTKLSALKKAIDEFYQNAFSPELITMLQFVEAGERAAKLIGKYGDSGVEYSTDSKSETSGSVAKFQLNLMKIRKALEEALSAVSLENDYVIFIDGIDVRPSGVDYKDYFDCVSGLVDAVWSVNSDLFSNIKGSKGRIRIVLLVRPDILLKTGLHNMNTKLRDNSVYLDWSTSYKDYRSSLLFKIADRLLSAQQSSQKLPEVGNCWDYYFPFHAENVKSQSVSADAGTNSFLSFLRLSYYRPRDINSMIGILKERIIRNKENADYVTSDDFNDPSFRDDLANYLLGEIRDQLLFYYSQEEYEAFLQFFSHLRGNTKFNYEEYANSFSEFVEEAIETGLKLPQFFESANSFLQFLYEQNVVCYKEAGTNPRGRRENFIRWCFRERTLSNMAPKVRLGVEYEIFMGLGKALNLGRKLTIRKSDRTLSTGTVINVDAEKRFGFLRSGDRNSEYYFKLENSDHDSERPLRAGQLVSFMPSIKYSKLRALDVRRVKKPRA